MSVTGTEPIPLPTICSGMDRSAVHVSLTAAGHRLAARVAGEVADLLAPMTSRLSAAEQKRLAALLFAMLDQPDGN